MLGGETADDTTVKQQQHAATNQPTQSTTEQLLTQMNGQMSQLCKLMQNKTAMN